MSEAEQEHTGTQQTQQTQPKQGEPIEIPVPKRADFDKIVKRAATRKPQS